MDTQQHHQPHLHIEYQGRKSVISLPDGELLEGGFRPRSCVWFKRGLPSTKKR